MLEPKNLKRIEKPVNDIINGGFIFKYKKDNKPVHASFTLDNEFDNYIGVKTTEDKITVEIGKITISFDGKKCSVVGEVVTTETLFNSDCYIIYVPKTKEIYSINEITLSLVKSIIVRYDEYVYNDCPGGTVGLLTRPASVSEKLRNIIELKDDKF